MELFISQLILIQVFIKQKILNIENKKIQKIKDKDGKISYDLNTGGNNIHIIIQKQLSNNNNINNNNNQPSLNININCNYNIFEKKLSRNEKKNVLCCLICKILYKEKIQLLN